MYIVISLILMFVTSTNWLTDISVGFSFLLLVYNSPEPKDFFVLNFERINPIYKSTD